MNKIIHKQQFSEKVFCLEVETPLIARSCRPGNFIIVRVDNHSERVPYTIAKSDPTKGTITMVIQEVGRSSTKLCQLNEGDEIADIVGPLGTPSHIENYGTIICAGGGIGIAAILPILTALKQAGNKVISVLAGRTKELVIMVDDVKKYSDEVIIMTDDGSYGEKGVITVGVEKVIQREHVDKVLAIGPPIMMKFTSLLAKKYGIPNDVSLNTIMVDGTGMCGACRLTIGGKTRFVCIDGPEFDGDLVDWDEMFKRMGTFKDIEISPNPSEGGECLAENKAETACEAGKATKSCQKENAAAHTTHLSEEMADDAWRTTLRKALKPKERTAIERVKMPELDADYRAKTRLEEVNIGLTPEMAMQEAKRCLDCPKPSCVEGCPVNIQIPDFIKILSVATSSKQLRYSRKHQLYQPYAVVFVHKRSSVRVVVST